MEEYCIKKKIAKIIMKKVVKPIARRKKPNGNIYKGVYEKVVRYDYH